MQNELRAFCSARRQESTEEEKGREEEDPKMGVCQRDTGAN